MREHMYCEPTGPKAENPPIGFFTPAFTISGKKLYRKPTWTCHWTMRPRTKFPLRAQTFACRLCCCTTGSKWWEWPPVAQMGASSCKVVSPWEMSASMGRATPSSSPSHLRRQFPFHQTWLKRWIFFSVIWRGVCCYGWPRKECLLSGSARAGCTGAAPRPNTLTNPTSWSEIRPSNFLIYPHFSAVWLFMHRSVKNN